MALDSKRSCRAAGWLFPFCAGAFTLLNLLSAEAQEIQSAPGLPEGTPDFRELQPPLPAGGPRAAQAPDWMVWQVFHDSLELYQRESPAAVYGLLESVGLSTSEADVVLTAGFAYLEEYKRIDAQFRADISRRFSNARDPRLLASIRLLTNRSDLVPALTPDGRPIKEALAAEGFTARLEEERRSAFRAHWELLAGSIGLFKLVLLERHIEKEVAERGGGFGVLPYSFYPDHHPHVAF